VVNPSLLCDLVEPSQRFYPHVWCDEDEAFLVVIADDRCQVSNSYDYSGNDYGNKVVRHFLPRDIE